LVVSFFVVEPRVTERRRGFGLESRGTRVVRCARAVGAHCRLANTEGDQPVAIPTSRLAPISQSEHSPLDAEMFTGSSRPAKETRARLAVVHVAATIALLASLAYLTWRALFTLGGTWWVSVPLWLLEFSAVGSFALYCFSLWDLDANPEVGEVKSTTLGVAVLIPTYNEPREVLLPTIAAAIVLEPAHSTWVLDDGDRPWVRELAESLGARYVARKDRSHAKAGNINHALPLIDADVIGILDADHVPSAGFLARTLGYFADPKVAVVQTPQDFYNVESFEHAKNRSWFWRERRRTSFNEQRIFYRAIQPGKNRWNAAFWCGTSALVRLDALREIGGVAHESVTEDMHTTIRLHRKGWRTVYHNEVLAHGLAARNADEYLSQRTRWGTGAMQILRLERPLTGPGLTLVQRVAYASTILGWFDAWRTLGYVLLPMVVLATGANPIHAPAVEFGVIFGATFLAQRAGLALLSRGYAPQGMAVLFEFVRMQSNIRATLTYFTRRERQFTVTSKQVADDRNRVRPPTLLFVLVGATLLADIWFGLTLAGLTPVTYHIVWTAYGAAGWSVFNGAILIAAVLRIHSERFATERRAAVRLKVGASVEIDGLAGALVDVSVGGALVRTAEPVDRTQGHHVIHLDLDGGITLDAEACAFHPIGDGSTFVMLRFIDGQDRGIAQLTSALFGATTQPMQSSKVAAAA
ncbi:MAG TPA: glycosyltransferase, partial [Acidimicrobiales bacterium]|nr:glycosyltransferase [Acidimicrobiales bacterium]